MSKNITNNVKSNKNVLNQLSMYNEKNDIVLKINKEHIEDVGISAISSDIQKLLVLNKLKDNKIYNHVSVNNNSSVKPIAFFMDHKGHYTGGRYYFYSLAVMLSKFYPVTFYTNEKPPFYNDFKKYYGHNFELVVNDKMRFNTNKDFYNKHNIVVGSPIKGGELAINYRDINEDVKLYSVIFESPNFSRLYRNGVDTNEDYWKSYKRVLQQSEKIITISDTAKKYLKEWDTTLNEDKITVIYPFINYAEYNAILYNDSTDKIVNHGGKKILVFPSRITDHKTPLNIFSKLNKDKYVLYILGNVKSHDMRKIKNMVKNGYDVVVKSNISDCEKYCIMMQCDAFLFPSDFEGFGMGVLEAGIFNKPIFAYKIPVFEEVFKESIFYMNKTKEADYINTMLSDNLVDSLKKKADYLNMITKNICDISRVSTNILEVFSIPTITAGIIVYNGEDYIKYAIKAIYDNVTKIIIVDGAVNGYNNDINDGKSNDKTLNIINSIISKIDYMCKIELITLPKNKRFWSDKIEQQNEIAKRINTDYYVKIDSDEIWDYKNIHNIINIMELNKDIDIVKMPFLHFWVNFKTIAKDSGGKWSTVHPRIWRWNKGYKHVKSFNYFQIKNDKSKKYEKVCDPKYREYVYTDGAIYHFGYVRKLNIIKNKINYYKNRGIEKNVIDTYSNWEKLTDKTQPTQPNNESWSEKYDGELPDVIKNHPYANIEDVRKLT